MKGLFIFAAGLAIGAVAGACLVRNKVLEDAKAEVEEVREYYRSKEHKEETAEPVQVEVKSEQEVYEEVVKANKYTDYNKQFADPFIINPEEFGEEPGYDTMTLTYFADGVLTDDVDEVVEDIDIVVGKENLKVFDEYAATSVYVRNELYRTDYEIIRDDWNYSDTNLVEPPVEKKPHQL